MTISKNKLQCFPVRPEPVEGNERINDQKGE